MTRVLGLGPEAAQFTSPTMATALPRNCPFGVLPIHHVMMRPLLDTFLDAHPFSLQKRRHVPRNTRGVNRFSCQLTLQASHKPVELPVSLLKCSACVHLLKPRNARSNPALLATPSPLFLPGPIDFPYCISVSFTLFIFDASGLYILSLAFPWRLSM
jgi:hypothetical protein